MKEGHLTWLQLLSSFHSVCEAKWSLEVHEQFYVLAQGLIISAQYALVKKATIITCAFASLIFGARGKHAHV